MMTRRVRNVLIALAAAAALASGAALAQESEEKSRFIGFLEGMLSTPGRQVTLIGVQGAFSSNPTVEKIVVADGEGPWLEIERVQALWNRTALFRRKLDISSLEAQRVTMLRQPAAEESGAGGAMLPVDVAIAEFNFLEIALEAPVLGAAARLSAEGSAQIAGDVVATRLSVERQDRPGTLSADLRLQPQENVLAADLRFAEPEGGLLAEWLGLRGGPAVTISLEGDGPLADWRARLDVQANDARVLAGDMSVAGAEGGYHITADLAGSLGDVAPEAYAALLSGESTLAFNVMRGDDGAIAVDSATIRSGGVDLAGTGALTPDLVPARADIKLRLGQAGRTTLPFVPGAVSVASLAASIGLDQGAAAPWRAEVSANGIESAFGDARDLSFTASGQARDLHLPDRRATTFSLDGSAGNIEPVDRALAQALGPSVKLTGAGAWSAGQPVTFENLQMVLTGATASFTGQADTERLEGRFAASITNLVRLAALADRPLGGSAQLQANGTLALAGGAFDLQLGGEATDLALGIAPLDPVLAGTTRVQGGLARTAEGVSFEAFTLSNEQVTAELTGSFADPALDLSVKATVANLASVTPRAGGRAEIIARVTGTSAEPQIEAEASGTDVVLMGRPLAEASASFSGVVAGPRTSGEARLSGTLGGAAVEGSARLAAGENGARTVENLILSVGQSRASGGLTIAADGLMSGQLAVVSPDLSTVAPLFLVEARGMLKADIALLAANGVQSATFSAVATDVVYESVTLGSADVSGRALDLFSAPQIDGSFTLRDLVAGGLTVLSATGTAERLGESTALVLDARLADGLASLSGTLAPRGDGLAVALAAFRYSRAGVDLALAAPTTILVENGRARVQAARLDAGGGRVTLDGAAGADLDMRADLAAVPAALANAFAENLGAEGLVSGTVVVTGAAAQPVARFDGQWTGASVQASRNAGLGPLSVATVGTLAGGSVDLTSRISGGDGLSLQAAGTVGTAPGGPLALQITGAVPMSLGNPRLAARGAVLEGALQVNLAVSGTAASPQFAGRVKSEGGGFIDPDTGIVFRNLTLAAAVSNNRLVIERLTAQSGEGTVSAGGSIGLDAAAGFPVDVAAEVRQARYVDGTLVAARFDADLRLTGSVAGGTTLGGSVFLDRTELTVPESLPRDAVAVDVKHVATPALVDQTLARARRQAGEREGSSSGRGGISLDLTVSAPQQIFVRGRGIDAELGGELRLTGSTAAVVADGAFEMRRGRLDIFTQRVSFNRGTVTFAGDLDPVLDFAGTTQSQDITITVSVAGQASDPEVTFSSVPELPQDEVLAHLIFNRGIGELSPVQIARLADAAAGLGGGGGGLLNQLRASTGLDDLDIVTDEEGVPALAAGRYVSENVYLGVQGGASGSSRVTIDLDITDDVKARAAVSPEGSSSIGVFFEKDY